MFNNLKKKIMRKTSSESSTTSSSSDDKGIKNKMSKKHGRMSTIPMVNREAVEILEEFLKKHQESLNHLTPLNSLYQKVSELEVNEEKPSLRRNQSYCAASHESLLCNEFEYFQNTVFEEELNTYTAPLASGEDSDSHGDSPLSAPEATYYRRKSSADSSSSDDSDLASDKRHKKSFFKRARERLRITLKRAKKSKKEHEENEEKHLHKKKRKGKKKKDKDAKVLSEVTTVTKTHIRQSSTMSDIPSRKSEITLRQGDVWESKDIKDKSGSFRHVKTHLKIKESMDSSAANNNDGFTNSFKRLKSLHKGGRKSFSLGKKDKDVELARNRIYRRSHSDSHEKCIHVTKEESKEDEKSTTTKIFNEVISMEKDDNCANKKSKEHRHLHLNLNPILPSDLPPTGNFEFESERHEIVTTIQTHDGQMHKDKVVEHHEHLNDDLQTDGHSELAMGDEDVVDGAVGGVGVGEENEQKEMYKRIASKLVDLADVSYPSNSEGACSASRYQVPENSELTDLEKEIVDHLLSIKGNTQFPASAATEILKQVTYNNFKQIVENYTKDKEGYQQIVVLFMCSKAAISLVGAGQALASEVKELTMRYFEDKFASYIVERGGWDSVLEDTDDDTEKKDSEKK